MILEQFFKERNSSKSTQTTYKRSIGYYEKLTGHTIQECLDIADDEEYNNVRWKNTQTRKWIIAYREVLYNKYNISTAQLYLTAVITIYRHFEITIPPLPYYSTKNVEQPTKLKYSDLPDREILKNCILVSSPLARALILFMSSSGVSRIDTLNLKLSDYLDATSEYHTHPNQPKKAVQEMRDKSIIPIFQLKRQKTGIEYFTFCSPEACKAINSYILTRTEILNRDSPLFKIHERYINIVFERLNARFELGKVGIYNRLHPHMLRRYHASQLREAKMDSEIITLLQGRKIKGVSHESYIRYDPNSVREEYIKALPYIVIEDYEQVKSELELVKEEKEVLENKYTEVAKENKLLDERITGIEAIINKINSQHKTKEEILKKLQ